MEIDYELMEDIQNRMILHWNYRNLRDIPQELLDHGQHIKEIYLKRNNLSTLPPEIEIFESLTNLYISGNQISSLPDEIGKLLSLKVLDVSQNVLIGVPKSIGNLKNLQHLVLTQNLLTHLPSELGQLTKLEFLELSGNKIKEISEDVIQGLESLEHFGIDGNPIQWLPRGITRLRNLRYISACGSNLLYLPSIPFYYLVNRKRAKGKYTSNNAVQFVMHEVSNNDSNFRFQFDSNPKLNYFPYWVFQLLGPNVDCYGCATENDVNTRPGIGSIDKIKEESEHHLKSETSNLHRISRSFASKIKVQFKERNHSLFFDGDLTNIQDHTVKEPPTLLELCLQVVYSHELLTYRYNNNPMNCVHEIPCKKHSRVKGDKLTTENTIDSHLSDHGTTSDSILVKLENPVLIPQNLNNILRRGPVTKCFECMRPQFTTTRLLIFHYKPSDRLLLRLEDEQNNNPQPDIVNGGIDLGCVHFCGDTCLSKFREKQSTSNSNARSLKFILDNEILWSIK